MLRRRAPWTALAALLVAAAPGCKRDAVGQSGAPNGENSRYQADRYVKKAVRRSPEGIIIMPSRHAEKALDRVRMNELAQDLRQPAAACFINRAIETMQRGERGGEAGFVDVPEGQAKFRVRINPAGQVVRTEVLDSGFRDEGMETCLREVLAAARWPKNRSGNTHFVDVVYWASLGFGEEDASPPANEELRRQQALAAVRAKACLAGRTRPGSYPITGISLLDRDGRTLVNRLEPNDLPQEVARCVLVAFREIRMPRAPEAFIRPFTPAVEYVVASDGEVSFADERWLTLILAEEEAIREARRAELAGGLDATSPDDALPVDAADAALAPEPEPEPEPAPKASSPATPRDPGKGGIKLDLGGRPKPKS